MQKETYKNIYNNISKKIEEIIQKPQNSEKWTLIQNFNPENHMSSIIFQKKYRK